MFAAANQISGLDTKTLPTELIPLNSLQLSRGLLNFAVIQSARDWVLPYWAEQQYDPLSLSFIPRSHLGLSINVTHRNWTAVGNPSCPIEPVVDQRGMVTPFRDGWSIDVWLCVGTDCFFPSRSAVVEQSLVENLPITETVFAFRGIQLKMTSYTHGSMLVQTADVRNTGNTEVDGCLVIAVRPFNPEGIGLITDIAFDEQRNQFIINQTHHLHLSQTPSFVDFSTFDEGDCAGKLNDNTHKRRTSAHCAKGIANGLAAFTWSLAPGATFLTNAHIVLETEKEIAPSTGRQEAVTAWKTLLAGGTQVKTPDPELNGIIESSLATVLMLTDGTGITPGPLTYHHFWFRDAAYMISALDKFGYSGITRRIVETFPTRQESSGFFRSQQGEWDSNGQAIWTVWQHAALSQDRELLLQLYPSLHKGVQWIIKKRQHDGESGDDATSGLLPPGLSAEHLGLVDYYYWDNAWSIAGLNAFAAICLALNRTGEMQRTLDLSGLYRIDLERSIARVQEKYRQREIPASPSRGVDCGMIGSCCFWHPLQLLPPDDQRMIATLQTLQSRFSLKGLFFQDFVHSGMNPYLTLQIAQSWLYAGERDMFWTLFRSVLSFATPTHTFPEAIHPLTGGGSMGDGHHGWVSAEILHAIRGAFVQDRMSAEGGSLDVHLCSGVPEEWFAPGKSFSIHNAPVPAGSITIESESGTTSTSIRLIFLRRKQFRSERWLLRLPFTPARVMFDGNELGFSRKAGGADLFLPNPSTHLEITRA
jgi:hypothetical protein